MKQKVQMCNKLEKDFTKLYKKQIIGDMDKLIEEKSSQIVEKYVHNFNASKS